jgi:membrane associated rhomboid family serine protease
MWLYLIIATVAVSIYAFSNRALFDKLSLKPVLVFHKAEVQRIFTHALVHADWMHLFLNMFVLYAFGKACEYYLSIYFTLNGQVHFLLLYVLAILASSIYTVFKHRNDYNYSAIGASGAVMAVVFTTIFFSPWAKIYFFGIPIPGIIFGVAYLAYSLFMGKKNIDNVGHDAHFSGALFGFLYPIIVRPTLITEFVYNITHP